MTHRRRGFWASRYVGEPITLVVAHGEAEAMQGVQAVYAEYAEYEPLPVVNSVRQALRPGAPLLHEALEAYKVNSQQVRPQPGSNVGQHFKIRKGDMAAGWGRPRWWWKAAARCHRRRFRR